jgi:hypothetical protein
VGSLIDWRDSMRGDARRIGRTVLTFSVTAGIGPIFAHSYGKTLATTTDHAAHLHQTRLFWISIVVLALIVSTLLKETGSAARSRADGLSEP